MERKNVFITETNCITPLGFDVDSNWEALSGGISGIALHNRKDLMNQEFHAAVVDSGKLDQAFENISKETHFTRLEKMLVLALHPMVSKTKITPKTTFILSTTKGNISLLADKNKEAAEAQLPALAKKISTFFGFSQEPVVISNACVSGVLAVAIAKRMIQAEMCSDAFVVAGDEISEFVLSGFNTFQAMSDSPCRPYDANRNGVTLGEAAAAVYVTSDPKNIKPGTVQVLGDGSVNDANHISGPSRTGEGLFRSIQSAMREAGTGSAGIDYISAHGTATLYNDEMEAIAFNRLGLEHVPVNSLKGFYGHTLGASGLLETVLAIKATAENALIASKGCAEIGVSQPIDVLMENREKEIRCFLKTASGFGGCNTAVLFQKVNIQ